MIEIRELRRVVRVTAWHSRRAQEMHWEESNVKNTIESQK
jgi:hypothetical protein